MDCNAMTNKEPLKCCPFCGDELLINREGWQHRYTVDCILSGQRVYLYNVDEWNRRADAIDVEKLEQAAVDVLSRALDYAYHTNVGQQYNEISAKGELRRVIREHLGRVADGA